MAIPAIKTFFQELTKRRVYRVAITYCVAASALVQVSGTVLATFHAPEWVQQVFVALLAFGFPIALILAWVFDMKGGMIEGPTTLHGFRAAVRSRRVWILGAIGLFLASIAFVGYEFWHPWRSPSAAREADLQAWDMSAVPEKSIAVLPFLNLSDDKQNAFFTVGVQDEILNDLARVADLKVISRTSVMQYKGGVPRNLREIAKALGVAHVVEGSVQRFAGRVRVTAQLIDARTDAHLWGEHYDRELADVFDLESELAERIVSELKTKLSRAEKAAIEERPTKDLAAYDLYLQAKEFLFNPSSDTEEGTLKAVPLLEQAITRDPAFLLAHCQLAYAHDEIYVSNWDHTEKRRSLAETSVRAAVRLQPDSGETHLTQAIHFYWGYLDYQRAREQLAKAERALPNNARIFEFLGLIDRRQGRWEEAIWNLEHAVNLDPRNLEPINELAVTYNSLRKFTEAIAMFNRALALEPRAALLRAAPGLIKVEAEADTVTLRAVLNAIEAEGPASAAEVATTSFQLARKERDAGAAARALASIPSEGKIEEAYPVPHAFYEGLLAKLRQDTAAAHSAFTAARAEIEKIVLAQPANAQPLKMLARIDAELGEKDKAIREARAACDILPVAKDAFYGVELITNLAVVYALTGEKGLALERLDTLAKLPNGPPYGDLRLDPEFDSLRSDPGFQKIVDSLAPKPANK